MAGDWIHMRTDLFDDPAVIGMAVLMGMDAFAIVGRLHRLWSFADAQSTDGRIPFVTPEWIDRLVGADGFSAAMQKVGWLEVDASGAVIPGFDTWMGLSAKHRLQGRERKRKEREATDQSQEDVTQMSRSGRDQSVTREEKRREEKIQQQQKTAAAADPSEATQEGRHEAMTAHTGRTRPDAQPSDRQCLIDALRDRGLSRPLATRHAESSDQALILGVCRLWDRLKPGLEKPVASLRDMLNRPEEWGFSRATDGSWTLPHDVLPSAKTPDVAEQMRERQDQRQREKDAIKRPSKETT